MSEVQRSEPDSGNSSGDIQHWQIKETLKQAPERDTGHRVKLNGQDIDPILNAQELCTLALSKWDRFQRFGNLDDLNVSIEHYSRAVALTPDDHPDMPQRLGDLGVCYTDRFQRLGELEDLNNSVEYCSRAVALTPDGHPDMPGRLVDLGVCLTDRFQRLDELGDIDKAIELKSRAVELTADGDPDLPQRLASLGVSYADRFDRLDELEDLDKAIGHKSRAVALTPDGHPDMSQRLNSLGVSYTNRFQRLDELDDLDKAIDFKSRAVDLTPDGDLYVPQRLSSLGVAYIDRFQRLGELDDADKSIEYCSRAIALTPDDHPDMPQRLANLGVAYTDRFQRLGEIEDLGKVIELEARALALTPDDHPDMPQRLANLGTSYVDRFRRLDELDDLNKAIENCSRAVSLTPDGHPDMPQRLAYLGVCYIDRFQRLDELDDLDKAIKHYSRSATLTPDGHPNMPQRLADLGVCHTDRFKRLGEIEDLEQAIELESRALKLTPDGHPDTPQRHFNQALSLLIHYQYTGNSSHIESSLASFRIASQLLTGGPSTVFQNALAWAKLASEHSSLNCIEAYQTTINLLPQFIWLGATTTQRYHDLLLADSLAVNAASAAILASDYPLAIEWLEHARCVVWNQSLMLRSPLDRLQLSHPDLASRLQTVANQLHDANPETQELRAVSPDSMTPEQVAQHRHRLAREYQDLLAQARQLPDFEGFLRPIKANDLAGASRNGPIVVINCHADRCDALLILPGHANVAHLPLTDFTAEKARSARLNLETSLRHRQLRERGVKPKWQTEYKDHTESVLTTLWTHIVKPVLDALGYTNDPPKGTLPHITWCPTGALSFLPLHAAGDYSKPKARVFNYAISSYTPTVTALIASTPTTLGGDCRVLAIGQAATPGHNRLPGTIQELAYVKAHMQDNKVDYSELIGHQATTTATLDAMEKHDWVHLACHAHQNIRDANRSGFFLHNGTLDLASINRRSFKNKGLAFLSACQTATGDEYLPDEAIHLASGMLMAGYPSVIATMWSVVDEDAPLVADKVYAQLMKDRTIGNGEAGKALHYAVAVLREKVGEKKFSRWVPYIHIGS